MMNMKDYSRQGWSLHLMPAGYLMLEHRLIERMCLLMEKKGRVIDLAKHKDRIFISQITDFLREYADKCHHAKEENVLFKTIKKKRLKSPDLKLLHDLENEHCIARQKTMALGISGSKGDTKAASRVILQLIKLYRMHIEKEDRVFFIRSMDYLSLKEQDDMLEEFVRQDAVSRLQSSFRRKLDLMESVYCRQVHKCSGGKS